MFMYKSRGFRLKSTNVKTQEQRLSLITNFGNQGYLL